MKNYIITVLSISLFFCQSTIFAQDLDVFLTINRFYQIESNEAYLEISYLVPFNAVQYDYVEDNQLQARLKSSFVIKKKGQIVNAKQFVLQTPLYATTNEINENLYDLVRLKIPENDTLMLEILIVDLADSSSFTQQLDLTAPSFEKTSLSDVMLITSHKKTPIESNFTRNELEVIPKFLNYYPTEISTLKFYTEFYNKDKVGNYLASYLLTTEKGAFIEGYAGHKKITNKNYDVVIGGFDISKLPSGNYYLFVELKDENNNSIHRKRSFFQRSNKNKIQVENPNRQKDELGVIVNNFARKYDLENMAHHLLALSPIATGFENASLEGLAKSDNLEQMQNYFYSFWSQRNSQNPEEEWNAYAERLQFVEKEYTNISYRGYQTPRGRLYLKHGKAFREQFYRRRSIGEFWIWNYELIDGQSNVNFVFLNRGGISDDFQLVHTNLRNSIFDKNWDEFLKEEF